MEPIMATIVFLGFLISTMVNFGPRIDVKRQIASVIQSSLLTEESAEEEVQPATTQQPVIQTSAGQKQVISLIDTYITSGPSNNETINDTNQVVFSFREKLLTDSIKERVYFETKVLGFDSKWVKTYSNQRTMTLPRGQYTFLVRARTDSTVDYTPAQATFNINTSPYFEKIKISRISTASPSLITLKTDLEDEETIDITGWTVEGKEAKAAIPQGVEYYYHYYNSYTNADIVVKKGDVIYVSSAYNPLGMDRNFRLNKCMGYLLDSFDFPLSIPKDCPRVSQDEISDFDPCCQQFLLKLKTCEIPDYSENVKVRNDKQCTGYVNENLNNAGCFMDHWQDKDFLKNSWHIYLNGKDITSDNCIDTIYLKDSSGLVVSSYSYGKPVCK